MLEDDLEKFGLTKREVKVYLSLLKLGESTTGKIIEDSKISGGKIYEILEKLLNKGLVSYIVKEKTKHFLASSPNKIIEYLEKRQTDLEKDMKKAKSIIPNLLALQNLVEPEYNATIHKGVEGFRSVINDQLERNKNVTDYVAFGIGTAATKTINTIWKHYNQELEKRKVNIRMIISSKETINHINIKKHITLKMIESGATAPMSVFGNTIIIYNWKELFFVSIKNQEIANSYLHFFNSLWETAKDVKL